MRILLVTHLYPPHHQAGVEQYTKGLGTAFSASDEVFVATTRKVLSAPTGCLIRTRSDGQVTVCEFVNNQDFVGREETYLNPRMERGILDLVKSRKIDVVHFQHLMYWSTGVVQQLRSQGIPVFLTLHDYWMMCGRMGQLRRGSGELCPTAEADACCSCLANYAYGQSRLAIEAIAFLNAFRRRCGIPLGGLFKWLNRWGGWGARRFTKPGAQPEAPPLPRSAFDHRRTAFLDAAGRVNAVIVPTQTFREAFMDWGVPASQILHVRQGRNHGPFENLNRAPRGDGALRVGFIGQVAQHKGVAELIAAVQEIDPSQIELRIIGPVVGDPSYGEECRAAAASSANIRIDPPIASDAVPQVYENLDVLVVPSLWNECSPLTIQEAFMSGVPVIASDIGGMREMIDHESSGLLVAPGDVAGLSAALLRLCDDEAFRRRLSDGVPDVCSLEEHIDQLRRLYRDALGGS